MSGKGYFTIERRRRKGQLLQLIKDNRETPLGKLKALFSLQTGLSFKKIEEYLTELEAGELIEYDEAGRLTAVEA